MFEFDIEKFGRNLSQAFARSGLTQEKVAGAAEINVRTFQRLLDGVGNPSVATVCELARVLGVSVADLIDESGVPIEETVSPSFDFSTAAAFLARFAGLKPLYQKVVLALIYKDPSLMDGAPPSLVRPVRVLIKSL